MIQLDSKNLPEEIQKTLESLQAQIDSQVTFSDKVQKAQSLWNSKGGQQGKLAFSAIFATLYEMCVYVGICNYCEQNEANDIEHIYPKSFFPEQTFEWTNYLLACKQCNSGYKLDKCFVIDGSGKNVVEVLRKQEPPFKTGAFINPRLENPNNFLILNLKTFTFSLMPNLNAEHKNKAKKSIEILELNTRDTLKQARKSAGQYYYHRIELLTRILRATSIEEIKASLSPYDGELDDGLDLVTLKATLKESFKKHISTYQHPSVWYSIKTVESLTNPKWKELFRLLPEALHWGPR